MEDDRILIDWQDVHIENGCRWGWTLALYAILHPEKDLVLYLGKADGTCVRSRWNADDKYERVWRRIEDEMHIFDHRFIVGEFCPPTGVRLTKQFVADVESLLIHQVKPWANIQCVQTRDVYRPGMLVYYQGQWPVKRKAFRDEQ